MLKNILIHIRNSIKLISVVILALILIVILFTLIFRPTYSVSIDGEHVGYSENKTKLQKRITEYLENGDGQNENVAFVQVEKMLEYKLVLLKKDIVTNDDEILEKVKQTGIEYYKYFAIADDDEEKVYVSTFEEAENIINKLKEKSSDNISKITIVEKYTTELAEFVDLDTAVSKLYVEKSKLKTSIASNVKTSSKFKSNSSVNINNETSTQKVNIGISLARPISGTISSRFGRRRSKMHSGLDIAARTGTPIKAAASGTVIMAEYNKYYGYMIVLSHGNGVQTYYAHCSKLYVKKGKNVSQGEVIAAVGSTGNSTGPHLHLEVRVNGVAYNPQYYVY